MMRKIFASILLVFALAFPLANVNAQEPAPSVVKTTSPVDGVVKADVNRWLSESAPVQLSQWVITYAKPNQETGDVFVSLIAIDVPDISSKWHITDDDIVKWMGSVTVHENHSVELVSDGGYEEDQNTSSAVKLAMPIISMPKFDGGGSNVRFPWESGASMMYGTNGVHAAGGGGSYAVGFSAVDFLGGTDLGASVASNRVYAVATGAVDFVCQDDTTTLIRTENTETDDYYIYAHLLENNTLTENYTFYQGDYIGSLKYGKFDDTCGWANQTAQHYHLHFGFKPSDGSFTMENCVLGMNTQAWQCGDKIINTGQFLRNDQTTVTVGDDASAFSRQTSFWDYLLIGASSMWDQFVVDNMPDHTANQFLYALYNGIEVSIRVARVMVYSNINLSHLVAVLVFGMGIKALLAVAEFIVFLFKAWKSLIPIIGA